MDKHAKSYLYAVLFTLLIPVGYILNSLVVSTVNPVTAAIYMFSISLAMAIILILATGRRPRFISALRKYPRQMALLGGLTFISATTWFVSLSMIGPSVLGFLTSLGRNSTSLKLLV